MEYLFRKQVVTVRRKIRKLEHSDWFLTFVGRRNRCGFTLLS